MAALGGVEDRGGFRRAGENQLERSTHVNKTWPQRLDRLELRPSVDQREVGARQIRI